MTPWGWFWGEDNGEPYAGEYKTREDAIAAAEQIVEAGQEYEVLEARMSTAQRYVDSDFVPFLRTRNKETRVAGGASANV